MRKARIKEASLSIRRSQCAAFTLCACRVVFPYKSGGKNHLRQPALTSELAPIWAGYTRLAYAGRKQARAADGTVAHKESLEEDFAVLLAFIVSFEASSQNAADFETKANEDGSLTITTMWARIRRL